MALLTMLSGRAALPLICYLLVPGCADKDGRTTTQGLWKCFTEGGAQARKEQVERGMLPNVVFEGESQPASVEARLASHEVPAISVAVIRDGKLDWSATWGKLQADGPPADCGSVFQAGSIAKPVTLLAALRMEQQGRIDFGKSIETYLTSYHLPPGQQTDANPVTFGNLFAHTSGITPGGYNGYAQGQPIPSDLQTVRAEAPSNSRKVEVQTAPCLLYTSPSPRDS